MAPPPEDDPLVVGSHFNYRNRPRRDQAWGVLYGILLALTIIGGAYGIMHRWILTDRSFSSNKVSMLRKQFIVMPVLRYRHLLRDLHASSPRFFRACERRD